MRRPGPDLSCGTADKHLRLSEQPIVSEFAITASVSPTVLSLLSYLAPQFYAACSNDELRKDF
jgi:hypothetical protein